MEPEKPKDKGIDDNSEDLENPEEVVPVKAVVKLQFEGKQVSFNGKEAQGRLAEILKDYKEVAIEQLVVEERKLEQEDLNFIRKQLKSIDVLDLTKATIELDFADPKVYGFKDNKNVKHLILPSSLDQVGIGNLAYTNLEQVTFTGDKLKSIKSGAFALSNKLKTIELPESVEILDGEAFSTVLGLERIVLPKAVSVIPKQCFVFDKNLKEVVVEGTVRHLGDAAFSYCSSLETIKFTQSTPPNFNEGEWPFPEQDYWLKEDGKTARFFFLVPKGTVEAYQKAWKFDAEEDKKFFKEY